MILSKDRQKIVKVIGILLALQGLIWIALSLTGIIVKSSPPKKLTNERHEFTSYEDYLSQIIFNSFMSNEESSDNVIRPVDFLAFLWIYFVLSCIWVAASVDQYFAIKYTKPRQSYITLMLGVAVLLTSVMDFVFVALLSRDYASCNFPLKTSTEESTTTASTTTASTTTASTTTASTTTASTTTGEMIGSLLESSGEQLLLPACKLAKGIIMTLAARGYVLWAMNVALGIWLVTIGVMASRTPALLTYENNTIPRIKIPEKRNTPSPSDEIIFFGDNPSFTGSTPYNMNSRNRNSTPVALNHKGQNLYY